MNYKVAYALAGTLILVIIVASFMIGKQVSYDTTKYGNDAIELTISGNSMIPTLTDGETVRVYENYYQSHEIMRQDLVAVKFSENNFHVKRVVGLPGDIIGLSSGNITVNNQPLAENYLAHETITDSLGIAVAQFVNDRIPEGYYLILGDNRAASQDSRAYGLVLKEQIVGRVTKK